MADVTGAIHREFGGRNYTLRLTMSGIAALQEKHGNDIGGLLTDGGITGAPPMRLFLDVVTEALLKGEKLPEEVAREIADELLSAEVSLAGEVLKAAFPDADPGNGKAPAKRRR